MTDWDGWKSEHGNHAKLKTCGSCGLKGHNSRSCGGAHIRYRATVWVTGSDSHVQVWRKRPKRDPRLGWQGDIIVNVERYRWWGPAVEEGGCIEVESTMRIAR